MSRDITQFKSCTAPYPVGVLHLGEGEWIIPFPRCMENLWERLNHSFPSLLLLLLQQCLRTGGNRRGRKEYTQPQIN